MQGRLREGQPDNADYPEEFGDDTGQPPSPRAGGVISIDETLEAKDKTVDVEVCFKQQTDFRRATLAPESYLHHDSENRASRITELV